MYSNCSVIRRTALAVLTAFILFDIGNIAVAQWDFELVGDIGIVYTDNLRLESDALKESETVFTVAPTFTFSNTGDRISADIRYRPEAFLYADATEGREIFHTIDAAMTTQIIRDALFLDTNVVKYQTIESPNSAFATTNLPITGNRVDSTVYEIAPYWDQSLGFAEILMLVSYTEAHFDLDAPQTSTFNRDNNELRSVIDFSNREVGQGFTWGIAYEHRRVEYEQTVPWEYQSVTTDIGFWLQDTTRVFVSGGLETPFDSYFDPSMEDDFWEIGIAWDPNQRISMEFAAGERSFGDTVRGQLSYRFRRGQTSISYTERAATRGELSYDRRPLFLLDNTNGFLDTPGASDRFVRKIGDWVTTIGLAKSDLTLRAFSEAREERTTDVGTQLDDELLVGASIQWSWQISPNSSIGLSADVARREFGTEDSDLTRFGIDYEFRFSQRLSAVLAAYRSKEDGGGLVIRDYTENQLRLMLRGRL